MLNSKTLVVTCVALASTATAIPASAYINNVSEVETRIRVSDLQTEKGLMRVYSHLERTANQRCGVFRAQSLSDKRLAKDCAEGLLEEFILSVNDSNLTKLYESKQLG